ncbi:hypothetical protein, partial [Haemophilus influenzae]|uniref:hypothetical protein n=1 Tax=Haemophilus influenzae TaxID=727 RepID=UPI00195307C2
MTIAARMGGAVTPVPPTSLSITRCRAEADHGYGRGRERAYAYFFYPGDKALTETAHERLKTIAANTELGAGLAVAQRDLEIRGAGNLLGGAQS